MDITIHTHHNLQIRIEISYFDTVSDIKQIIQSLTGIVSCRQTLFYNNAILQDQNDVATSNLFDNSRVRLLIANPSLNKSDPDPVRERLSILVRNPISRRHVWIETDLDSSVSELKQSISETERIESNLFNLFLFGKLMDLKSILCDFPGIKRNDAVVEIVLEFGGTRNNCSNGATAKVVVAVVPMNLKVTITVTLSHCFGELRRELERLRKEKQMELPESWMFVYKTEKVAIENTASFEKFKVVDGDVIQIHSSVVV